MFIHMDWRAPQAFSHKRKTSIGIVKTSVEMAETSIESLFIKFSLAIFYRNFRYQNQKQKRKANPFRFCFTFAY